MHRNIIHLVFVTLLFGLGCKGEKVKEQNSAPNEKTQVNLELRKTREFTLKPNGHKIGTVESPMLMHEKNGEITYIFYDLGLNQILISDTSGTILQTMGKKGSGPKEFLHITSFGTDADTIVVYDGVLDMVKKFNFSGELIDSYQGLLKDKIWLRSNRLYSYNGKLIFGVQQAEKSSSHNHWESKTIAVYDRVGNLEKVIGEFDPDLVNSHQLYNYATIVSKNGMVYTTHRTSPTIQKFDLETGKKFSRFGIQSEGFKVSDERPKITDPREVKNKINVKYSFVGDSFVTDDYFAFYFFNFTEKYFELRNPNDQEHFLNLYNNKEEFVGEIRLPFLPLGMDNDNRVYLLENDDPDNFRVGVYEIVFNN